MNTFSQQLQPISSAVFHWAALPVTNGNQREGRKIAEGTTNEFEYFEMHATIQAKGAVPSPPHTQEDIEEVIIVTDGKMKCMVGDKTGVIGAGGAVLVPALEPQAFENVGDGPLKYYVFMFRSKKPMDIERSKKAGGGLILDTDSSGLTKTERGSMRKYFDRPTMMCEGLEMYVTQLDHKGPSHDPHQHVDTEIILMLEGHTTMMIDGVNYSAGPGDLYIAESGKMHGISNAEDKPCSYFTIRFR